MFRATRNSTILRTSGFRYNARFFNSQRRLLSTSTSSEPSLRRSYLYVPASSDRMLEKSLVLGAPPDVVIYDLEDSVSPPEKRTARHRLSQFLHAQQEKPQDSDAVEPSRRIPAPERVAVRVNDIGTPFFEADVAEILRHPSVGTLVLPKIHTARDLHYVSRTLRNLRRSDSGIAAAGGTPPLRIVASMESARAVMSLAEIAAWKSEFGAERGGELTALLFAAEDYCADTSVVRTASKQELLYVRCQIVIAAKAFGLEAIDMVCVNYKDPEYLRAECQDGRRLGFTGKQVIHPNQVVTVNASFVPTYHEILRAAKILHQMSVAHSNHKGAFGLEMEGGGKEMIDAPMLKQAENVIRLARAAGCDVPHVE